MSEAPSPQPVKFTKLWTRGFASLDCANFAGCSIAPCWRITPSSRPRLGRPPPSSRSSRSCGRGPLSCANCAGSSAAPWWVLRLQLHTLGAPCSGGRKVHNCGRGSAQPGLTPTSWGTSCPRLERPPFQPAKFAKLRARGCAVLRELRGGQSCPWCYTPPHSTGCCKVREVGGAGLRRLELRGKQRCPVVGATPTPAGPPS